MVNETRDFIFNALSKGSNFKVILDYIDGTWFAEVIEYGVNSRKFFFTEDSRLAQLYLHDIERIISDVRYLRFNGKGQDNK